METSAKRAQLEGFRVIPTQIWQQEGQIRRTGGY